MDMNIPRELLVPASPGIQPAAPSTEYFFSEQLSALYDGDQRAIWLRWNPSPRPNFIVLLGQNRADETTRRDVRRIGNESKAFEMLEKGLIIRGVQGFHPGVWVELAALGQVIEILSVSATKTIFRNTAGGRTWSRRIRRRYSVSLARNHEQKNHTR
jgi:hypothetical protein